MKIKFKLYLLAFIAGIFVAGCVEDTGNYIYQDPDELVPIINSMLEEHYDAILQEQLEIEIDVEGDESKYDFAWYAYPTSTTRILEDTLSHEMNLNYRVDLNPGLYTLVLKVTDKVNKTSTYQETSLSVSSIYGVGYYVSKTEEGNTDLDFIDRFGVVNPNILSYVNGESLSGEAINSAFFSSGYSYQEELPDGGFIQHRNKPAFLVCSDNDFRIYQGETLQELADFETAFMETPAVRAPGGVVASSTGFALINNNRVHMLPSQSRMGKLGYPFPNRDYDYSKYFISGTTSFITYDDNHGQFLAYTPSRNEAITDANDKYKDYDLLFFAAQPFYLFVSYYSYAVLKHRTEDKAYVVKLFSVGLGNSAVYQFTEYPVPMEMGILDAGIFAISGANPVVYYSNGDNHIRYYNHSNQTEQDVLTLPEDEKVVYIKNVYDLAFGPNIFLVLSEKGGNWMLRVYNFEGSTPDLAFPATETYSGTGKPSTVIFRNANTYVTY